MKNETARARLAWLMIRRKQLDEQIAETQRELGMTQEYIDAINDQAWEDDRIYQLAITGEIGGWARDQLARG